MKPKTQPSAPRAEVRTCPICGKPASEAERPFCSRRCADIDLYHWLSGGYAVPVRPGDEADDSELNDLEPDQD